MWLVAQLDVKTPTKMNPNIFITPTIVDPHPPIGTFFLFKDIAWLTSSSLLLIEVKTCWSSKGQKIYMYSLLHLLLHVVFLGFLIFKIKFKSYLYEFNYY